MSKSQEQHEQISKYARKAFEEHTIVRQTDDVIHLVKPYPDGKFCSTYAVQLTRAMFGTLIVSGDIGPVVFSHGPGSLDGLIRWVGHHPEVTSYILEKARIGTRNGVSFEIFAPLDVRLEALDAHLRELAEEGWSNDHRYVNAKDYLQRETTLQEFKAALSGHGSKTDEEARVDLELLNVIDSLTDQEREARVGSYMATILASTDQARCFWELRDVDSAQEWNELVYDRFGIDGVESFGAPMVMDGTLYYAHAAVRRASELLAAQEAKASEPAITETP